MDDYLSKPLRPDALDAVLERWLGAAPAGGVAPVDAAVDELIDAARMRTFRDDYPDIVDQLVDLFVQSTPPLLGELRSALDGGDRHELRRTAHKLKGSCQNIGASGMAAQVAELERDPAADPEQLDDLEVAFEATCDALRAALTPAVS
jgi:HPt (histidine-containing phosphotransfer) domain-containing protein